MDSSIKFAHGSDLHSILLDIPDDAKFTILSGDFLPNQYRVDVGGKDAEFQKYWLRKNLLDIQEWLKNKPTFFLTGNHDRFNPADILSRAIPNVYNLDDQYQEINGIRLFGITGIPFIAGEWNTELTIQQFADKFEKIDKIFKDQGFPDILVTHTPPYGMLDSVTNYIHIGSTIFTNYINYQWKNKLPKFILFGHCHENPNTMNFEDTLLSNAATIMRLLEF